MAKAPLAESAVMPALERLLRSYNAVHTNDRRNTPGGHWINEAFVVRLYAVLDAHKIVGGSKKLDKQLDGWKMVEAARRLRHEIAHSTGEVDDDDAKRLDTELRQLFDLTEERSLFDGKFLLPKDRVLRPMHQGCLTYCAALLVKERAQHAV